MNTLLRGLARSLSDSDVEVRDMGVAYLVRQIPHTQEGQLSALDLAKIWRGLFFCMWHSDGPFVQDALAEKLGSMVCLWPATSSRFAFARAFFDEMREMWEKIDDLRADKFRRLVRCVVTYTCRALALARYDAAAVGAFQDILCSTVYDASAPEYPVGLTVYVSQILLEVLEEAASVVGGPVRRPRPRIAFEETVEDSAAALEADEEAQAAEAEVERAGDSMQRLKAQVRQTRAAVCAEDSAAAGTVPAAVTAAVLEAAARYYERGTSRTVVNVLTERVVLPLCCKANHPRIQRDMDAFLERLNRPLADESVVATQGGQRLARYYALVLAYKQRGWEAAKRRAPTYEEVRAALENKYNPAAIAKRSMAHRAQVRRILRTRTRKQLKTRRRKRRQRRGTHL